MLKAELKDVKEINGRRKERQGVKCRVLKNTTIASTDAVEKALRAAEKVTDEMKKATTKGKKGKGVK